jgi:hypothetical protein
MGISGFLSGSAVFFILIFPSPLSGLVHEKLQVFSFFLIALSICAYRIRRGVNAGSYIFSLTVLFWGLIGSLVAGSSSQAAVGFIFAVALNYASIAAPAIKDSSIAFLTRALGLVLFGAWISVVYGMLGGMPIWSFTNPDGRSNFLFLSSFSNSETWEFISLIRPSGLYDEPGALSFAITIVVILRELRNSRSRGSLFLMLGGLITLSVSHVVIFALYFWYYIRGFPLIARVALWALLSCSVFFSSLIIAQSNSVLSAVFLERFVFEDGRFRGDNRSGQVADFFQILEERPEINFRGALSADDAALEFRNIDQSSNPFSTWFYYGVFVWIFYLGSILYISWLALSNLRNASVLFGSLALVLLLLQRPYVHDPSWCIAVWLAVFSLRNVSLRSFLRRRGVSWFRVRGRLLIGHG